MELTQDSVLTENGESHREFSERNTIREISDKKKRRKRRDRVYEQLGASCLLYRHGALPSRPEYVPEDDFNSELNPPWTAMGTTAHFGEMDPYLHANMIHQSTQRLRRTQARWHYPMDFLVMKASLFAEKLESADDREESDNAEEEKKEKHSRHFLEKMKEVACKGEYKTNKTKRPELHAMLQPLKLGDPFGRYDSVLKDKEFAMSRVFGCVDEARQFMLDTSEDDNEIDLLLYDEEQQIGYTLEDLKKERRADILCGYRKYDHSYLPARWKVCWYNGQAMMHLPNKRFKSGLHFSQQRKNYADPAYLAPFRSDSLQNILRLDHSLPYQREKTVPISVDDPNHPSKYGNCLVTVPCPCPICSNSIDEGKQATWCLLHPVGKLLDKVAVSTLSTPNGSGNAAPLRLRCNMDTYKKKMNAKLCELDIGDTILQLEHCGGDLSPIFVARTRIHVTVFSVVPQEDPTREQPGRSRLRSVDSNWELCYGLYDCTELHRIDLRSFSKQGPSYLPVHVSCHPKFGNSQMSHRYKFAILSHSNRKNNEHNVIHHFLWFTEDKTSQVASSKGGNGMKATAPSYHVTKHTIRNLSVISEISFSPRHPMILWAVAKSYVRPALVPDRATRTNNLAPRLGHGYSLFTIDLRSNEATFQWSPSAEEFLTEGVHAISGIAIEWNCPNRKNIVWVSSVSAGKVWEIDGRLPCRMINMWSLPSQSDELGPTLPSTGGLYGSGTILAWPSESTRKDESRNSESDLPLFSVGRAPESYALHLYQRPKNAPRFQTESIECAASSSLQSWAGKRNSIATSSVFPLPDVSDRVFTCGLAAILLPVSEFLEKSHVSELACHVEKSGKLLCAITMTNRGDLYVQNLLELRTDKNQQTDSSYKAIDGLPIGSMVIPAPPLSEDEKYGTRERFKKAEKKLSGGMNLYLHLSNEHPLPRQKAQATISPDQQSTLRPFKYSDLKEMPIQQESAVSDADPEIYSFRTKIATNDVLVTGNNADREAMVKIPANHGQAPQEVFVSVRDCFACDQKATVESDVNKGDKRPRKQIRSDLTGDILQFADNDWTRSIN